MKAIADNSKILPPRPITLALILFALHGEGARTTSAAQPSLRTLDFVPTAVSANGEVVVGTRRHDAQAVRWTAAGGTAGLGYLEPDHSSSEAVGVSADGSVVVGHSESGTRWGFRWSAPSGMIAVQEWGLQGYISDVSGDGRTIIGGIGTQPGRWTAETGFVPIGLGAWIGGGFSAASQDGTVLAGSAWRGEPTEAVRWNAGDGIVNLSGLPEYAIGNIYSAATDVSADGSVIVGWSDVQSDYGVPPRPLAFRFTADTGMIVLDSSSDSWASGVAGDGSVVVGSRYGSAFIWDPTNGMRSLHDVLTDLGVDVTGWQLERALAISADGSTIIGTDVDASYNTVGWVATVPEPATLPFVAFAALGFARWRTRRISGAAEGVAPPRRRLAITSLGVGVGLVAPTLAASAAPVFELVATHPDATQQATALGQTIQTLKPFNGKLYAGFGDYFSNTGPIGVRAFDPATGAFGPQMLSAQTEALLIYREIGGKLYAPHIDPWPSPPPPDEMGGYSLGIANGTTETWTDHRVVPGIHMLDVATFDGHDLWIAGSRLNATGGTDGVAWRSQDGGATWEVSLVVPPQRTGATIARLYAIQAYNGKLYTQPQDSNPGDATWGPQSVSKVFDGTSWSNGPSLGGGVIGNMWHPETFAGELVWDRLHGGSAGRMSKFNGTRTALAYPDFNTTIYDYTIDGDLLYALASDGRILQTSDLVAWSLFDTAPASARSIGVLDGTLYLGGTGGQLFRYPEPAGPLSLAVLAGRLFARARRVNDQKQRRS